MRLGPQPRQVALLFITDGKLQREALLERFAVGFARDDGIAILVNRLSYCGLTPGQPR